MQGLEPAPSPSHRSKSRTPQKTKKARSTRAPKEVYDTAWEDALLDKITADTALHSRILRYEVRIHFELRQRQSLTMPIAHRFQRVSIHSGRWDKASYAVEGKSDNVPRQRGKFISEQKFV